MAEQRMGVSKRGSGRWVAGFLTTLALGLVLHTVARGAQQPPEPTFSIEAEGTTLGRVLEQVGEQVGYTVKLAKEWADEPVTAHIVDVRLDDGLGRLLSGYNHYLVTDTDQRTVTVRIFGVCGAPGAPRPGRRMASPPPIQAPVAAAPTSGALLVVGGSHADEMSERGSGVALDTHESVYDATGIDPSDIEVVPPTADGTPAATLREITTADLAEPQFDLSQIELVPPGYE